MKHTKQKEDAENLQCNLPTPLQRSRELAQEKEASTWLTAFPIEEHVFALHKAAFRDSLFSQIWLATPELTIPVQLWTCPDMQNRRLPSCET